MAWAVALSAMPWPTLPPSSNTCVPGRTVEKVSPPPEDVARLFRALGGPKGSKEISSWVEMAHAELTVERSRRGDAILPQEAGKTWGEDCTAWSHADQIGMWRANHSAELRRGQMVSVHKSLFPSIGDVIFTASCRALEAAEYPRKAGLVAGQTCVVRYRLQGACSYYGHNHTVLKDEREPVAWHRGKRLANPRMLGHVEMSMPSYIRSTRGTGKAAKSSVFELRLFCSSKQRIIGCIGEPVWNQTPPPPLESLQLRCEGCNVTLRWNALDLLDLPKDAWVKILGDGWAAVYERRKSGGSSACADKDQQHRRDHRAEARSHGARVPQPDPSRSACRDPGWEVPVGDPRWLGDGGRRWPFLFAVLRLNELFMNLLKLHWFIWIPSLKQPMAEDTDYEFRVRAENVAGSSRDVISHCRINASCPAPANLTCAYIGTAHVDLEWIKPSKIGNEATKDAYQIRTEAIQKYVATLRVVEQNMDGDKQEKDLEMESH
eukprot:Skav216081  [mRNA]  locus=scaffold2042:20902:28965:+ [translate_table: standard]